MTYIAPTPHPVANIREVAQEAGVSIGTVSNVFNRPHLVAEPTRRRVEDAVERLGYVLNASARSLRHGRSQTVGLLVMDIRNPFFTELARGLEDAASEAAYAVVLGNSDGSEEKERYYLRVLEEQRVGGVVLTPVAHDERPLARLRARGMHVVLLDRPASEPTMCSVAVDDVLGGRLALQHLLDRGHRRIAVLTGPRSIQQCEQRWQGAREAVSRYNLDPDEVLVAMEVPAMNADAGERAVTSILALHPAATAVFCINDLLALGVIRAMMRCGRRVPDDLAIIGYDDVEFAGALQPPLTTVRQPMYRLGEAAMQLFLDELRSGEEHSHRQLLLQPQLVVRDSTGGEALLRNNADAPKSSAGNGVVCKGNA